MQNSFEPRSEPSQAAADTRELVTRLSFSGPSMDDATVNSVAEATGKSPELVRAQLDLIRLEKRVNQLESRPTSYQPSGQNWLVNIVYGLKNAGPGGMVMLVFLGIAIVTASLFLSIGLMVAMMH